MGEYRQERLLLKGRVCYHFYCLCAILCHSYNLEHVEEAGNQLEIDFRIYPEGHVYYHVAVDPFARTFTYKGKVYSTDDFRKVIEADRVGMGIKA